MIARNRELQSLAERTSASAEDDLRTAGIREANWPAGSRRLPFRTKLNSFLDWHWYWHWAWHQRQLH